MSEYYEGVGIFHQKSVPRTPQQNGVVERRNRTLVEAARTMMIFSKAPMFLWAEAVHLCYNDDQDAPSKHSASSSTIPICIISQSNIKKLQEEPLTKHPNQSRWFYSINHNLVTGDPGSAQSSSGNVNSAEPNQVNYPPDHLRR
ncbi:retrovirus-related pol polyprotein from transposon TNT 1-94 [Tanacetum coccineum]